MEPRIRSRSSALKSASTMKSATMIRVRALAVERVVISEDSAVGHISVVVINDIVVMPVGSPMVPSPTKPAKIADSKAEAPRDSRALKEQPWIPIPARPNPDRLSIRKPGIILRHVNDLRVGGFDHNGLPLIAHLFL